MSTLDPKRSDHIDRMSPSLFHELEACALRVAFRRQHHEQPAISSSAALLGRMCHAALEQLVVNGELWAEDWSTRLLDRWHQEVATTEAHHPELGPPDAWPGFHLKRARLRTLAAHLRELVAETPRDLLFPEVELRSQDGLLFGRADLIVRGQPSLIIDYKTGGVIDLASGLPREAYRQQMQLYAYLEQQTTGAWPHRAILMPLAEDSVDVHVEAEECLSLAERARAALAAYNTRVPAAQPANAGPVTCAWCEFAVSCDAFWHAAAPTWPGVTRSIAGMVQRVWDTRSGDAVIAVCADSGTETGDVMVRGLNALSQPRLADVVEQRRVRITALHREEDRKTLRATLATRLAVG
jgi:RecB family exonuclease